MLAVGSDATVWMYSDPVELFAGEVPSSRMVSITIPADAALGKHSFVQFGNAEDGSPVGGGCVDEVVEATDDTTPTTATPTTAAPTTAAPTTAAPTTAAVLGNTQAATPAARTGQTVGGIVLLGGAILGFGLILMTVARRRNRQN